MKRNEIEDAIYSILEDLAQIEHERWSHWQEYLHSKGHQQSDGSLLIPANLVEQWKRQIATPYAGLSEKEKESDRDQVMRYLPRIIAALKE